MSRLDVPPLELSPPLGFASELERVVEPVRRAFRQLLAEWGSPATAADLDRMSGSGATLCWQVFRVANSADAVAEARHVPTPTSLKRLLASGASAGVSAETVAAVETAARDFLTFSKHAASDRTTFQSMLAGAASEQAVEKIPVSLRRSAYRSITSINGVQTDLIYTGVIVRASATARDLCDQVALQMHSGIRRLRPDAQLYLHSYLKNPSATPGGQQAEAALDEAAAREHGMPILPQFSMSPLPEVEQIDQPVGYHSYHVTSREVGLRASIDCTFGRFVRNTPLMRDTDGRLLYHSSYSYFRRPAALSVQEILLHRPSFPGAKLQHMIFQYWEGGVSQEAARSAQQYPVEQKLTKIGRADVPRSGDVPRYADLLRFATDKVGWDLSEFDVYRFRLQYPVVFSTQRMFFYVT